jgi:glutamate dehydrogenase
VGGLVLRDNYDQAQALATSLAQAASMAEVHERYLRSLEAAAALSRELEFLPGDESLAERRGAGGGLTAPELAILLSYTKAALTDELVASPAPDEAFFSRELERYFPFVLRERFAEEIARHPLRREIVASRVANELVNRAGTTFAFRLGDETGAATADVARAYAAVRDVFGLTELWAETEALDGAVPADVQVSMTFAVRILLERAARWILRNRPRPLDVEGIVARFAPGATELARAVPGLLGAREAEAARAKAEALVGSGVPEELAGRVAHLEALVPALDLVELADRSGFGLVEAATVYYELGARLELHWLRDRIVALPRGTRWEAMARAALRDDVYAEQAALAAAVVGTCTEADPRERVEAWLERHSTAAERCLRVLADMRSGGGLDLARLSVGVRELRNLIASSGVAERTEEPARRGSP